MDDLKYGYLWEVFFIPISSFGLLTRGRFVFFSVIVLGRKSGHYSCSQPPTVYVRQRNSGLWNAQSQGENSSTCFVLSHLFIIQ